jgi:hypothetical protein
MDESDAQISWDNCLKDFHEDASKRAVISPNTSFERFCHVYFYVFLLRNLLYACLSLLSILLT